MKKIVFLTVLSGALLFTAAGVQAQFRSVPAVVTDSFKAKYPNSSAVSWSDKLLAGGFQASFTEGKDKFVARFGNNGEWQWSTKKITKDELPSAVKDGYAKSKYAGSDWEVKTVTMKFMPGNTVQYLLFVQKSDLNKKNLTFSSEGQLLKDEYFMMKKKILLAGVLSLGFCIGVSAQPDRWQQRVKYTMNVDVDVNTNRFTGSQTLSYTNNSPDTLKKVFYHLYWNAFQPGSMMDTRSRELGKVVYSSGRRGGGEQRDWDSRVRDRILNLKPEEIGYQHVLALTMNGAPVKFKEEETILEVELPKAIGPHTTVVFQMKFEAQVPLQIRRSGRDNPQTGVRYSMSQWYPKICEYDYEGWHPTPYVAREFYGVWGDYDVKISIDKRYILGGTGYLENAAMIGYGYEAPGTKVMRPAGEKLTWHFTAPEVHDFMWAADPDYKHLVRRVPGGPTINVLYKNANGDGRQDTLWTTLADAAVTVLPFIEKHFGKYPYKQYSFVHGGDGGMEYPMSTLLVGPSLGGAFHEWMHSWYQGMLGTNEGMYPWMDEGFTTYAEGEVTAYYHEAMLKMHPDIKSWQDIVERDQKQLPLHQAGSYSSYFALVKSGLQEPLTTHADHFNTNFAYSIASYSMGAMFIDQLGYIVGAPVRDAIMLEYYKEWRFKHPNASDFLRIAEKESGIKLDWYREYWINTSKTIDYAIDSLWEENGKSNIRLKMVGQMPMPIDVVVTYKDGTKELAYIPQYLMFGAKEAEDATMPRTVFEPWKWTSPTYTFTMNRKLLDIKIVEIDPTQRMADVDRKNNKLELNW